MTLTRHNDEPRERRRRRVQRWRVLMGFGHVFATSRRAAFGIALLGAFVVWNGLEQVQGAVLPWTFHNGIAVAVFCALFGVAWALGVLGGTLGWFAGGRLGRAEVGAAAGVAGLWIGLAVGLGLLAWNWNSSTPSPTAVPLVFLLPLLGPWIATRYFALPALRAWSRARSFLQSVSRLLSHWLVLKRPIRLDARGLALGLTAGLLVAVAASVGAFWYPEAMVLAQRVRLRNEPIRTPAGPIELSRYMSLQTQGTSSVARDRGIVVLQIDDWTQNKLLTQSSEAALNARLLRRMAQWHSGPVVLPISSIAITTPPRGRGRSGFRGGPRRPGPPRPPAEPPPPRMGENAPPDEAFQPTSPPLDPSAMRRALRDMPSLVRALRDHPNSFLCWLPPSIRRDSAGLRLVRGIVQGLRPNAPVARPEPPRMFRPLLESGRPVGSAEFATFYVPQVQSLEIIDRRNRWALPLLLAAGGDRSQVTPAPTRNLRGTLFVAGHTVELAEPGEFLVNVYGSTPDAIFPHVSYSAVLSEGRLYDRRTNRWVPPAAFFRDRIVFLDTLSQPTHDTPIGAMKATELLAMATDNLLTMNALEPPSLKMQFLLLALFGALAGHLAIGRSPLAGAVRMAVLILFYSLASALLFVWPGLWLPTVSVGAGIGCAYLFVIQFVFTVDELELERQRAERVQYEREVTISRAIQTSLLPEGHVHAGAFEIVSRSVPAREVGGDFYNIFALPDAAPALGGTLPMRNASSAECGVQSAEWEPPVRHSALRTPHSALEAFRGPIGIVLGDVSGNGVQGAMYMTVATTLLEARAQAEMPPEEVLAFANTHLYPKIHRLRMFVTVFYGVLDVETGELEFASAGQVRPIRVSPGTAPEYQPSRGVPLGALRGMRYERHSLRLAPGETLLLASDGFIEARNPRGDVLGYGGFLEVVARHSQADPERCLDGIFEEVRRFTGDSDDQDDRTLVVIRHHAGEVPLGGRGG